MQVILKIQALWRGHIQRKFMKIMKQKFKEKKKVATRKNSKTKSEIKSPTYGRQGSVRLNFDLVRMGSGGGGVGDKHKRQQPVDETPFGKVKTPKGFPMANFVFNQNHLHRKSATPRASQIGLKRLDSILTHTSDAPIEEFANKETQTR